MIAATADDFKVLQSILPVNTPAFPLSAMMRLHREGRQAAVHAYFTAHEFATVQFALYREILKQFFSPSAVANAARYHLADYVRLANWLEKQCVSPVLFLRAQTETLRHPFQVRGMCTEKALVRYDVWEAREAEKYNGPAQALDRLEHLAALRIKEPLLAMLSEHKAGADYVAHLCRQTAGMTRQAVIFCEAWHLPGAFLITDPDAMSMAERNLLDDRAQEKMKQAIKCLVKTGNLHTFLAQTVRQ